MAEKIKALFIYEILGRPAEHIRISLEQLLDQIGENKGIEIINRKVHPPAVIDEEKKKQVGVSEDIFTTFAEVEMEIDGLNLLYTLVMNTLPSSIEITEPTELRIKSFDLSNSLSELAAKLHRYDEVAKGIEMEKVQMVNLMKEMDGKIRELGGESPVKFEVDGGDEEGGEVKDGVDNGDREGGKVNEGEKGEKDKGGDGKEKDNKEVSLEDMEGVKSDKKENDEEEKSDVKDESK
tara:strand:- start:4992 stop:5699 length:708 start_codon:yes stop_codon:yes gene_type:complete